MMRGAQIFSGRDDSFQVKDHEEKSKLMKEEITLQKAKLQESPHATHARVWFSAPGAPKC